MILKEKKSNFSINYFSLQCHMILQKSLFEYDDFLQRKKMVVYLFKICLWFYMLQDGYTCSFTLMSYNMFSG